MTLIRSSSLKEPWSVFYVFYVMNGTQAIKMAEKINQRGLVSPRGCRWVLSGDVFLRIQNISIELWSRLRLRFDKASIQSPSTSLQMGDWCGYAHCGVVMTHFIYRFGADVSTFFISILAVRFRFSPLHQRWHVMLISTQAPNHRSAALMLIFGWVFTLDFGVSLSPDFHFGCICWQTFSRPTSCFSKAWPDLYRFQFLQRSGTPLLLSLCLNPSLTSPSNEQLSRQRFTYLYFCFCCFVMLVSDIRQRTPEFSSMKALLKVTPQHLNCELWLQIVYSVFFFS